MSNSEQVSVSLWGGQHIHVRDHVEAVENHAYARLGEVLAEMSQVPRDAGAVILDGCTAAHREQLAALSDAMPVFVEKPLGVDLVDAEAVCGLLGGRVHGTGLFWTTCRPCRHGSREYGRPMT